MKDKNIYKTVSLLLVIGLIMSSLVSWVGLLVSIGATVNAFQQLE